jgi:CheY-like chemotaxis protein
MSHELRTPLNGILGYTQILSLDKNLTPEQREGIDIIHRSGEHLLTLINDILDLSKIEAGKVELNTADFHFQAFLKDIVDLFRMRVQQKGIGFKFLGQEEDLPIAVHADEKRLRQVLLNLLSNAVKFTDQGQCTFSVHSERFVETNQRRVCFEVGDSGQGIDEYHLETIFLPFQQVGNSRQHVEGTGLGLPISRKLVELMGGRLQVESTLNQGSKFWFEIVLPEVGGFEQLDDIRQPIIVGFKKPAADTEFKTLIVDDLRENRTILVNLLTPLGFNVQEAVNGEDALEKAYQYHPDLVIMDLKMPIMDGLECTRQLRQDTTFEKTVIITVTASAFEYHQQESLRAGSDAFLAKPVVATKLFQLIQTHCALDWVYEESVNKVPIFSDNQVLPIQFVIPPPEIVNSLLKFAQSGDVQGIAKETMNLADTDESWQPFLNEVHKLAKSFKVKKLKDFLKKHAGL